MRQNVQDYAQGLSIYVLATNMESLLAGNQNDPSVIARADAFARFRRAKGVMLVDKENEEVSAVSLSVAGIDRLLALEDLTDAYERALWLRTHEPGVDITIDELARRAA